jgi:restriction system protein
VFITSSTFTANARDYANAISTRVILIDGQRLAQLMIKYRVGVQVKQSYEVVEIDEDFFE